MKHRWLVITLVGLVALVPAVAWAQDSNRVRCWAPMYGFWDNHLNQTARRRMYVSIPGQKMSVLPATANAEAGPGEHGPLRQRYFSALRKNLKARTNRQPEHL